MKEKLNLNEYVVPAFFLILPYAIISYGLIWKSQGLFFVFMILPIMAFSIRNWWIKAFLFYLSAWQMLLFLLSFMSKAVNPGIGLTAVLASIAGIYLFKRISESELPDEKWFSFIRIAVIFQLLIAFAQYAGFNIVTWGLAKFMPVRELMAGTFVGTAGNRNFLMSFVGMSIPMFMGWRVIKWHIEKPFGMDHVYPWDIKINVFLIVILIAMLLSPSPAVLAAAIGIAFFWGSKRAVLLGMAAAAAFFSYYVLYRGIHISEFTNLSAQLSELWKTGQVTFLYDGTRHLAETTPAEYDLGRFGMWLVAISKLMKSWLGILIGFGPGSFWGKQYNLHNEYLYTWFQFGIIGFSLLIGYIVTTIRFLAKSGSRILLTSFVILCLDMIGNYPLHIPITAFLAVIVCGLIERERLKKERDDDFKERYDDFVDRAYPEKAKERLKNG